MNDRRLGDVIMGIRSRILRLERSLSVPCTLCGGRGRLVLAVPGDRTPICGCDRCGRLRLTWYPIAPPPGTRTMSVYMYQQELRERRRAPAIVVRPGGAGETSRRGR